MESTKRKASDDDSIQHKKGKWSCHECDKTFEYKKTLNRHVPSHASQTWKCDVCHKDFGRKYLMKRHSQVHGAPLHSCCGKSFWRNDKYHEHLRRHNQHGGAVVENNEDTPQDEVLNDNSQPTEDCSEEALGGTFKVISIPAEGLNKLDPMMLLKHQYDVIKKKLEKAVIQGGVKWYLSIQVQFSKPKGETVERVMPHFRENCQISLKEADIDEGLRESIRKIYSSFIEYQRQGSNWTLDKVLQIQIHLAKYTPLKGSSYIPLPVKLRSKHAVVNVYNKDKKCFMWSVLSALYPSKINSHRVSKYIDHQTEPDFTDINFPVKVADVQKFEIQNKMSIYVLGYEMGVLFPVHVTKQRFERHIDLKKPVDF